MEVLACVLLICEPDDRVGMMKACICVELVHFTASYLRLVSVDDVAFQKIGPDVLRPLRHFDVGTAANEVHGEFRLLIEPFAMVSSLIG